MKKALETSLETSTVAFVLGTRVNTSVELVPLNINYSEASLLSGIKSHNHLGTNAPGWVAMLD